MCTARILALLSLVSVFSVQANAMDNSEPGYAKKVESLAAEFHLRTQLSAYQQVQFNAAHPEFNKLAHCRDDGDRTSCVKVACDFLGTFGCDDQNEITKVATSCRGNYNGECVKASCGHLGTFDCDDFGEVSRVATACRGVRGASCINEICSKLGTFGCDDLREIETVANSCK